MLFHNLKISWRNLMKYKLQTAINVVSIAIGIVVLAAVHSMVHNLIRPASITTMPYYDRACMLSIRESADGGGADGWFDSETLRAIMNGGEVQCAELGPTFKNSYFSVAPANFYSGDSLVRRLRMNECAIEPSYAHYAGYKSVVTGKRIAVLKPGEAILPEEVAQSLFGDVNPVGMYVEFRERSVTIVDVYETPSMMFSYYTDVLLYCMDEEREDINDISCSSVEFVLKEGSTALQLEDEINVRLQPLGKTVEAKMLKEHYKDLTTRITLIRTLSYLFGSLILLAAVVGFLRMQTQLFWMRRREMSLRMVNGAKRGQLFMLMMTEVGMIVVTAVGLALMMGSWLERFIGVLWEKLGNGYSVFVDNLPAYSAVIGGALLLLCAAIVWILLARICNSAQGLAASMRGSRNHNFRNVMLWLQVTVGMLFVSAAIVVAVMCNKMTETYVLPDDDSLYKESLLIEISSAENMHNLLTELKSLPDVAQVIPLRGGSTRFNEINPEDSLLQKSNVKIYHQTYLLQDTALLDFLDVQVKWLRPELKDEAHILIHEEMYGILERAGVLANGILTPICYEGGISMPVAGTFKDIVFEDRSNSWRHKFIAVNPIFSLISTKNIFVPRKGRYHSLLSEVQSTVARLEPTVANKMIFNFYEAQVPEVDLFMNIRKAGWILGGVSLLVCLMSIYSTITLDVRARRKEVAIRKINGAKAKDIALLFTRLYIRLTVLAVLVLIPLVLFVRHFFNTVHPDNPMHGLKSEPSNFRPNQNLQKIGTFCLFL